MTFYIRSVFVRGPHTCNFNVNELHIRSVSVREPHTRKLNVNELHTHSIITVSEPHTRNLNVNELHTHSVTASEPHRWHRAAPAQPHGTDHTPRRTVTITKHTP